MTARPPAGSRAGTKHGAVQVYRGRLRSTGEEVAVKVQRPGIGENIAIDMVLLRRFMTKVDAGLPQLSGLQVSGCLWYLAAHHMVTIFLLYLSRRAAMKPPDTQTALCVIQRRMAANHCLLQLVAPCVPRHGCLKVVTTSC